MPRRAAPAPIPALNPTPRARQIVAVARELLEQEGPAALTMRRLAERLGIRAPSLYKHLPDKAALEAAIIATGFEDAAARLRARGGRRGRPAGRLRRRLPGVRARSPAPVPADDRPATAPRVPASRCRGTRRRPLQRAAGDPARARAVLAFAHGMVLLELTRRLPPGADPEAAWKEGIAAFQARIGS